MTHWRIDFQQTNDDAFWVWLGIGIIILIFGAIIALL